MSDTRPRNPSQSPSLLEQVVPKLRPFQREALEFATEGKLYDRQRQRQRQQQHAVSSMAASTVGSTNGQPMTARISGAKENSTKLLLADEMGLGKVRMLPYGILQRFLFIHQLTLLSLDCNITGYHGLL